MGTLYENVFALCSEAGIKPGKMCNDTGISRGLITDLKMGRKNSITIDTAKKIAEYFNESVHCDLGSEQKEKSPTPDGVELIPGYEDLSEENKIKAKDFIAFLLSQQ